MSFSVQDTFACESCHLGYKSRRLPTDAAAFGIAYKIRGAEFFCASSIEIRAPRLAFSTGGSFKLKSNPVSFFILYRATGRSTQKKRHRHLKRRTVPFR